MKDNNEREAKLDAKLDKSRLRSLSRLNLAKLQLHEARVEAEKLNRELIDAGFQHLAVDCW